MYHLHRMMRSCGRAKYHASMFCSRYLSTAQTAEVLRPFLFSVHPDFFGRHPAERAENEKSLKQLSSYIDSIQRDQRVTATDLAFFLRKDKSAGSLAASNDGFTSVHVSLSSTDIYTVVRAILKACALSTSLVEQYKKENDAKEGEFPRPVEWHQSYYSYTGQKSPYEKVQQRRKKPEITLSYWLKMNIAEARQKLANSQPIREECESLREAVIGQLGLEDVRWESTWNIATCHACLRTLLDLGKQHWAVMQNLKGSTVVLADVTRMTPSGVVVLGSQDVPHHWVSFVSSLPQQRELLPFIPPTEGRLSVHLGGCRVAPIEEPWCVTPTAHAHYRALMMLIKTMEKHDHLLKTNLHAGKKSEIRRMDEGSLKGLKVIIEGTTGQQYLDTNGDLHIMCNRTASSIIRFLSDNAEEARDLQVKHKSETKEESLMIAHCLEELELATLTRSLAVSPSQMITCCRQLRDNPLRLGVVVSALNIQIDHHYALARDGNMRIPWNWKQ